MKDMLAFREICGILPLPAVLVDLAMLWRPAIKFCRSNEACQDLNFTGKTLLRFGTGSKEFGILLTALTEKKVESWPKGQRRTQVLRNDSRSSLREK
jgi:hypothetical protein